jgi:hypothetical protein
MTVVRTIPMESETIAARSTRWSLAAVAGGVLVEIWRFGLFVVLCWLVISVGLIELTFGRRTYAD